MAERKKSGQFDKGHSGFKPPGAISKKTALWNELGDFFVNDGAKKFVQEISSLSGKDYINAYSQLIEFFKPKLSRIETTDDLSREIDALTDEQAETLLNQLSDKIISQWMQKVN
jgi:hypothetical protein